jgi:NADPH:quinone reductase-like Zn-dependent oxidoreductase
MKAVGLYRHLPIDYPESLLDLEVETPVAAGRSAPILGGAGGVGSIAIRLAKKLARLEAIATASRPESPARARGLGAGRIVDHAKPLPAGLEADYVLCFSDTGRYFPD